MIERKVNPYTVGWLAWGGFFCLLEGTAIAHKEWNGTLSNHVRRWIGASCPEKHTWWCITRRGGLTVFMSWLTGHFVMGWWG